MTTATPARHPIPPDVMLSSWVALWDELIGSPQDDEPCPAESHPEQQPQQRDEPPPDGRNGD